MMAGRMQWNAYAACVLASVVVVGLTMDGMDRITQKLGKLDDSMRRPRSLQRSRGS